MSDDKPEVPEAIANLAEIGRRASEALKPFADIHRHLASVAVPLAKQFEGLRLSPPPWLPQLENTARQFIEAQKQISRTFQSVVEGLAPTLHNIGELIKNVAILERQGRLLKDAGFLPHSTMPVNLIEECADDPILLSNSIEKHYRDNWPQIQAAFIAGVNAYSIDDEAKAVFREALTAHEIGHFRSVVRLLFPEIERVATTDGTLKRFVNKKGLKPIQLLQELAGKLSVSDVQPRGYFGLALFQRLTDHLYVSVWTDEKRTHMEADTVPNRHAAVHGLVVYRSFKNSLNTLFMTDYVFQIIDVIKKSASEVQTDSN
jgi:hypothetical protein